MQNRIYSLSPCTPIYCVHFIRDYLPLSLGMIISYARSQLSPKQFDLAVRFASSMDEVSNLLFTHGPGIFLFSNYMWNVDNHLKASAWIKQHSPQSVTIHGGPSFPSYPDASAKFLNAKRHIDFGAIGEGERTTVELLNHLANKGTHPHNIPGLSFLKDNEYVRTPPRERSTNLDEFPSPYLTGVFDEIYETSIYAILETNRGCPYGCTFCDWGSATLQKIRCFSMDRVRQEVQWMSEHKMRDISIADANFGIFARDIEICRLVCEAKKQTGYPERVMINYSKNTHKGVVEIVDMMAKSGVITSGTISIQTRDPDTLAAIHRRNIKTEEYEKLQIAFGERGLPMDTQLMIGLPGSTLKAFKEDLRFYFFKDVNVRVFRTVLLPNSPMADPAYRALYQIATDDNGTIVSNSTMTSRELIKCDELARIFRCAHGYGVLRYFLSYLFWDHHIDPIDYLETLLDDMHDHASPYATKFTALYEFCHYDRLNEAAIARLRAPKDADSSDKLSSPVQLIPATHIRFREKMRISNGWQDFFEEIREYTCQRYELANSSTMNVAIEVQMSVMPVKGRYYPFALTMEHNYAEYYKDQIENRHARRNLENYAAAVMQVDDPLQLSEFGTYRQDWTLTDFWQLCSPLPGAGRSTLHELVQELRNEDILTGKYLKELNVTEASVAKSS